MSSKPVEEPLEGGNTNTVVRCGDTVRRNLTPHSQTIHRYLTLLRVKRVPAPEFLGIDPQSREILSYVEGETEYPGDLWLNDDALIKSCQILRHLHDASVDFVPSTATSWAYHYPDQTQHEVICHNDFAPYNMVFRDGLPIAILDFDLCGPGPRIRDLAYLAFWMVPLSFTFDDLAPHTESQLAKGCPRLKLLCETYGGEQPDEVIHMISEVLEHMSSETSAIQMLGSDAAERLRLGGHFNHWAREAEAFDAQRKEVVEAIRD